jgi:hypothetical protein
MLRNIHITFRPHYIVIDRHLGSTWGLKPPLKIIFFLNLILATKKLFLTAFAALGILLFCF